MKKLLLACMLLFVVVTGILVFMWSGKEHMSEDTYQSSEVYLMPEEDVSTYAYLFDYVMRDKEVQALSDLEKNAELIVKAKLKQRNFVGIGIINECSITSVYKGSVDEDAILVYDFVPFWGVSTDYFEGAIPLKQGEEYLMFLKTAPNSNVAHSFVFTSINFGHFRLTEDVIYQVAYDLDHPMSVGAVSSFDHVSYDDRYLQTFLNLHDEIIKKYKSYD